nr:putative ribonuclease H-like domain-containing protein [Tanacetum cinerariifolium]
MTAKLRILNPTEYDLWLMRIEQYFLMTDYSLRKVIKNGNKVLMKIVGTVEQPSEPIIVEEKLDMKNEMKARGTLLMALSNKDQLKFYSCQDARFLMEAIEKRYGGNKESKKENVKSKSDKGYHAVPPPYTGNYIPPKPDLMFIDEQVESESVDVVSTVSSSTIKTVESKVKFVDVKIRKGKQHKASYKAKLVNSVSKPLHMLHMDLFGLTNVKSLMRKSYCLVITDDFSRFSWVFFLTTKDETSRILKTFIIRIENQLDCKVKVIRCDTGTEFKNSIMNQLCDMKGIKREFSVPRTPQQNIVAERKNRTLIEAARTMLVDSKLPTTFWVEAVNTACYVLNRALVIKPHNKTPYELIHERPPLIDFMKPFECPVTILNTRDYLGKFDEKADEGFFVAGFLTNGIAGTKDNIIAGQAKKKKEPEQDYILIPICTTDPLISQGPKDSAVDAGKKATKVDATQVSDNDGSKSIRLGSSKESNSLIICSGQPIEKGKGKQHKASYKAKLVNSVSKPLHMLHMDLFGLTNVKSLMRKSYCLVITDDFSRFSWVFFLTTKDETSRILKTFITGIENQLDCKVKVIRCDTGTEFKNSIMNQFCDMKGIKREFSVPRTPQQNIVAERKNITLIEAARTMLVDSKLPTTFWAEAVNTACYVLNRALVIKPHNKTPYELIRERPPLIDFMKPFECPVTILNTRDYLGKFDEKADEGFFVAGFLTNGIAGTKDNIIAGQAEKKKEPEQDYILIPICTTDPLIS